MRIVLATPLYPPEIAEPAPYVKELARRLSTEHQVTIVAYTHLPETLPRVEIIAVEKGRPLLIRLMEYMGTLARVTRHADVVYAVNGTSVELPLGLVTSLTRVPILFCLADPVAHAQANASLLRRFIEYLARMSAVQVITDLPLARPEILPLELRPEAALAAYEASWKAHLKVLNSLFTHAR